MPSQIVSQTAQGTILSVTSNIIAQVLSSYKHDAPLSLNIAPIIRFAVFSVVSGPPNILWQGFLEDVFPTNVPMTVSKSEKANEKSPPAKTQMSKANVLIKLLLDQTIGAVVNNLMFLVFMGYMKTTPAGKQGPWDAVEREVRQKFWPIMVDGLKVWPFFSLISFLFIPVDKRIVAGCLVGVGWTIYLSLMVGS